MGFKDPGYLERKSAATDAKKAALEKFRANAAANAPAAAERQAGQEREGEPRLVLPDAEISSAPLRHGPMR